MKPIFLFFLLVLSFSTVPLGCKRKQPPPKASFSVSGSNETPATLTFTNTSQNADSYLWIFGDGRTSNITNPTITYDTQGHYTVTLIAIQSSTNRSDTAMQVIVISTPSPIANFTISGSTVSPATLTLTNSSQNADRYFWDFGDNRTSTITNPNVTYERAGVYAITLTAFQTSTGKSHKFTRSVQITPSKVSIRGVYFQKIPFTTGYGAGWDIDSGPDLFYEISVGNSVLASSSVKYELTPSHLPLFIPLKEPCVLSDWNQNYEIKIYDLDKFSNSDCLCVVGFVVNELNRLNDYPTEAPIQNRFANLILTLEWW